MMTIRKLYTWNASQSFSYFLFINNEKEEEEDEEDVKTHQSQANSNYEKKNLEHTLRPHSDSSNGT